MRLLIVGSDEVFSIENYYYKYLQENGVEVCKFAAQSMFYSYYNSGIINKVLFKSGLSGIYKQVNKKFRATVCQFRPEIIWVFKGMEIYPASIEWAKSQGIKLVNYNPDNPFIFSGTGSGNSNVTNSIGKYDLHYTYNLEVKKRIINTYKIQTEWLPFGFEIADDLFTRASQVKEVMKACFVGNPDTNRISFFHELADEGIEIDLYGHGWEKFIKHKNIQVHPPVYRDELYLTLRKYRVQLNPLRIHNLDSHGMRSFEVPAIGGIMLAPRTTEHVAFFEEGKEAFYYNSTAEAKNQISLLLATTVAEANKIRQNARRRSLNSGYSYQERAKQVLASIK